MPASPKIITMLLHFSLDYNFVLCHFPEYRYVLSSLGRLRDDKILNELCTLSDARIFTVKVNTQ